MSAVLQEKKDVLEFFLELDIEFSWMSGLLGLEPVRLWHTMPRAGVFSASQAVCVFLKMLSLSVLSLRRLVHFGLSWLERKLVYA